MNLTQAALKEFLFYDDKTGIFTWIKDSGKKKLAGKVAGYMDKKGYWSLSVMGRQVRAHRLAWLYVHGFFPDCQIDHRNGVKTDNKIENLRLATNQLNQFNIGMSKNNSSGFKGVCFVERNQMWRAKIMINGKTICLGYHMTAERASMAYKLAAYFHHKDFYFSTL